MLESCGRFCAAGGGNGLTAKKRVGRESVRGAGDWAFVGPLMGAPVPVSVEPSQNRSEKTHDLNRQLGWFMHVCREKIAESEMFFF